MISDNSDNRFLVLIRHSAVKIDPDRQSQEWSLSSKGRNQCHKFSPKIKPFRLDRFFTSHEPKAIETGSLLAGALNVPMQSAPGLQEHKRRNVPLFASEQEFRAAVARFFSRPDELVFGQETAVQARNRVIDAFTNLAGQYPHSSLAIVTHGTVLTLFVCSYNPHIDPITFWNKLEMPCAAILELPDLSFRQLILPDLPSY